MENRVVVTGLGAVTPIGVGLEDYWEGLIAGRNGVSRLTHFNPGEFRSQMAAEVNDFDPLEWIDRKSAARMDRFAQFAIAASTMAMTDAGLDLFQFDGNRAGVIIGSGIGGSQTIEDGYASLHEKGPGSLNPFFVSKLLVNMAACMVSIRFGLKGPLSALSVACSTGSNAIGDAFRILQRGDADIMVAGSAEACITPLSYAGFCSTRSLSTRNDDPEHASRPFDKERDGFVMGEGAGIVILEALEHALSRGASVHAELIGYGATDDAYHITAPSPDGQSAARAMSNALADGGVKPEEVDYINAHGTSTPLNDKIETLAIKKVFGDYAYKIPISSNKSMIGHLLGAAGVVELIATILSMEKETVPPTINYEFPDPECDLDYVPNKARPKKINVALSNSLGFGGHNATLVVRKYIPEK